MKMNSKRKRIVLLQNGKIKSQNDLISQILESRSNDKELDKKSATTLPTERLIQFVIF